jgi:hypothetical protein
MQIFTGLVILAVGSMLVIKSNWFLTNFGRMKWFEEKLGSDGGSRLGYKLIGVILIFIGLIMATGSGDEFFSWILAPLNRTSQPE